MPKALIVFKLSNMHVLVVVLTVCEDDNRKSIKPKVNNSGKLLIFSVIIFTDSKSYNKLKHV